jgi:beta-glucanase (GH16 family)
MSARRALAGTALVLLMPAALLLGSEPGSATDTVGGTAPSTSIRTAETPLVRVEVLPQIVQQGGRVASPDGAKAAITATVKPVVVGRQISLQVQRGPVWEWVDTVRQDAEGRAQFAAPAASGDQPLTYRVKAVHAEGLKTVTSQAVSTARWLIPTWTDEFSGAALSPKWHHRGQNFEPHSLRSCSKGDPTAVQVAGGAVRLSVLRDLSRTTKCRARVRGEVVGRFAYRLNGHIGTEGAFSFKYGFAAARVKFHHQRGQHGGFWMQPVGGMYPGGTGHEIDIIEYFGDKHPLGGLATCVHRYEGSRMVKTGARVANARSFLKDKRDGWSRSYHVFSVQWTPQRLIFRIDGKETYRIRGGISSAPQYPILSLLASDYEFPQMKDKQLPQHMYVDWVRVWETGS